MQACAFSHLLQTQVQTEGKQPSGYVLPVRRILGSELDSGLYQSLKPVLECHVRFAESGELVRKP